MRKSLLSILLAFCFIFILVGCVGLQKKEAVEPIEIDGKNLLSGSASQKIDPDQILKTWELTRRECLGSIPTPDGRSTVHIHVGLFVNPAGGEPPSAVLSWVPETNEVYAISWKEGNIEWLFLKMQGVWKQVKPNPL